MKKGRLITEKKKLMLEFGQKKCSCGEDRIERLTVDHIVPQNILKNFGLSLEEMFELKFLQIMCRQCNSIKAGQLDFKNPKTKELLLDLLNNYL